MTPEQRVLRARLAAHVKWGDMPDPADRRKATAAARANNPAFFEYWLNQVAEECPGLSSTALHKAAESRHKAEWTRRQLKRSQTLALRNPG